MAIYTNIRKGFFAAYLIGCLCNICIAQTTVRDSVEATFMQFNGITERTGHNDGPEIKRVLATCGLPEGYPYCAATVNWTFKQVGIETGVKGPAAAANWFVDPYKIVYKKSWQKTGFEAKKAQVFGLWFPELGRIAHTGFIVAQYPTYYLTFEGNTSSKGAIETDRLTAQDREAGINGGFFLKKRSKSQIYIIADYLKEYDTGVKDWRKRKF